jgi:hypothetical protein
MVGALREGATGVADFRHATRAGARDPDGWLGLFTRALAPTVAGAPAPGSGVGTKTDVSNVTTMNVTTLTVTRPAAEPAPNAAPMPRAKEDVPEPNPEPNRGWFWDVVPPDPAADNARREESRRKATTVNIQADSLFVNGRNVGPANISAAGSAVFGEGLT